MRGPILLALSVLLGGCFHNVKVATHKADFFECPPNNHLVVCPVGAVPTKAGCEPVGGGDTTLGFGSCRWP
jgi:hypothetical protein